MDQHVAVGMLAQCSHPAQGQPLFEQGESHVAVGVATERSATTRLKDFLTSSSRSTGLALPLSISIADIVITFAPGVCHPDAWLQMHAQDHVRPQLARRGARKTTEGTRAQDTAFWFMTLPFIS